MFPALLHRLQAEGKEVPRSLYRKGKGGKRVENRKEEKMEEGCGHPGMNGNRKMACTLKEEGKLRAAERRYRIRITTGPSLFSDSPT